MKNVTKKIKLMHVIWGLEMGGAENFLKNLVATLDRDRFSISVCVIGATDGPLHKDFKKLGVNLIFIPRAFKLKTLVSLVKLMRQRQPDIVHTQLFGADLLGRLAAMISRVPVVMMTEQNTSFDEGLIKRIIKRILSINTDRIVVISEGVRAYSRQKDWIPDHKMSLIANHIDMAKFARPVAQTAKPIIGSVARLTTQKAQDILLQSFAKVVKSYPQAELWLIGEGQDEDMLKSLTAKLNLIDNVKFLGVRHNVPELLSQMSIFAIPSRWEGLGIAAIEASAAGLPVVASRVGGLPEVVQDGTTGLLVEPEDIDELANVLEQLISNPAQAKRMGEAGRVYVGERFALEQMTEQYEKLYEDLARAKGIMPDNGARPLTVLQINKFYSNRAGAERYMFELSDLLVEHGHKVIPFAMKDEANLPTKYDSYFVSNVGYHKDLSLWQKAKAFGRLLYSFEAARNLDALIKKERPDIAHLHNIAHQLSPSIIHVLKKNKVSVVQSLHDYKLISPNYQFLTQGKICERCTHKHPLHVISHKAMHSSYLWSFAVAVESVLHRVLRSYQKVDLFIAPSKFMKQINVRFGIAANRIKTIPYTFQSKLAEAKVKRSQNTFIYAGRLAPEKGIDVLLEAWSGLPEDARLLILGDGPEKDKLMDLTKEDKRVEFLGHRTKEEVLDIVKNALAVIVPSVWYENLPFAVIESMSQSTPVIGARIGGIPELVIHQQTGLLVPAGDVASLRQAISWALTYPQEMEKMGKQAQAHIKQITNTKEHYEQIMDVYQKLILEKNLKLKGWQRLFRRVSLTQ